MVEIEVRGISESSAEYGRLAAEAARRGDLAGYEEFTGCRFLADAMRMKKPRPQAERVVLAWRSFAQCFERGGGDSARRNRDNMIGLLRAGLGKDGWLAEIEKPLKEQLYKAKSRKRIRAISERAVKAYEEFAVVFDVTDPGWPKGVDASIFAEEWCLPTIRERLSYWREQLGFINMTIAEDEEGEQLKRASIDRGSRWEGLARTIVNGAATACVHRIVEVVREKPFIDVRDARRLEREVLREIGLKWPGDEALDEEFQRLVHRFMSGWASLRRSLDLKDESIVPAFPYWLYLTVGNGKPGFNGVRPEHAALHGMVFRHDDAFWAYHDPPWDDGCRCTKVALTPGQVKQRKMEIRTLEYVRNVLKIGPGPECFRPSLRTEERVLQRLMDDVSRFVADRVLWAIDERFRPKLDDAETRAETLRVSEQGCAAWQEVAAILDSGRLGLGVGSQGREWCVGRVREHVEFWSEQLAFIKMRIAEEGENQ